MQVFKNKVPAACKEDTDVHFQGRLIIYNIKITKVLIFLAQFYSTKLNSLALYLK